MHAAVCAALEKLWQTEIRQLHLCGQFTNMVRIDISDASYTCHTLCLFTFDACHGTAVLVWADMGAEMNLHSCASPKQCTIPASYQSLCEQRKLTNAPVKMAG